MFFRYYRSIGFWQRPEKQYWNNENYTEKSKKELNKWAESLYKLKVKS